MNPYGYHSFADSGDEPAGHDGGDALRSPEEVLRRYWGYSSFRPKQAEIIASVLAGDDTVGLLPTGGGKSITFQVPALILPWLTIVVTPLISLMKDQVDNLRRRHVGAACLHSGMSRAESSYALERCRQGKVKMLYVSPERAASERFMSIVGDWNISLIVIDEAHCISQWGYDFRPSYLRLELLRERFADTPVLALTASATPQVLADIKARLGMTAARVFTLSFTRDNISFLVRHTEDKYGKLLDILRATTGCTIVYTRSRRKAADLAAMLGREGVDALFYHAGLEAHEKVARQDAWQSDRTRVMVATTAFGMGIDKPDVRLVVHYDPPSTLEEYYQEAGRAGRDGKPAVAVLLAGSRDKATLARRLSQMFPEKDFVRKVYDEICRFISLPMGEGFGAIFDFKPEQMCARYKLPPAQTMSAIGILDRSGYFDFIEEMDIETQVMITDSREQLYGYEFEAKEEAVLDFMLRTYPGLFSDLVFVSEDYVARQCGVTAADVHEILKKWRREHIITYIPRRGTAQLFFTANRVAGSALSFPVEVYEERRQALQRQLKAMTDFIYDDSRCRVAGMLRYFGESDASDCGKCDVCRSRAGSKAVFDAEAFEKRLDSFFAMIAPERWLDTRSLRPHFPHTYDSVVAHLASMVERGALESRDHFVARIGEK
ncbi:MAG: RecQ family ATP-dependent DNA helicase [Muribaculaceae bacterium]|nr:RecQ family ATP-dependent DNA helicase [Muribaculaceae bacterium]